MVYFAHSSPIFVFAASASLRRAAWSGSESPAPAVAAAPISVKTLANPRTSLANSVGVAGFIRSDR